MYPNFYRIQSASPQTGTWISLAHVLGWKKISIISDITSVNVGTVKKTMKALPTRNITLQSLQFFDDDPSEAVDRTMQLNARVIFVNCYHDKCPLIACQAYLKGFYGGRISWVFFDPLDFVNTEVKLDERCTPENLAKVDKGSFYKFWKKEEPKIYLNFTTDSFEAILSERITNHSTNPFKNFKNLCYDTVAPAIYMLDSVEKTLNTKGLTLKDEISDTKKSSKLVELFRSAISGMDIQLFAGRVKYAFGKHDVVIPAGYQQSQGDKGLVSVFYDNGEHLPDNERFELLDPIKWSTPDGKQPALDPVVIVKPVPISPIALEPIMILSIITVGLFGSIILKSIHRKNVKPNIIVAFTGVPIGMSCLLLTIYIYVRVDTLWFCRIAPILVTLGLSLISSHTFIAINSNSLSIRRYQPMRRSSSLPAPNMANRHVKVVSFKPANHEKELNAFQKKAPNFTVFFLVLSWLALILWYSIGGVPTTITKSTESYDAVTDELTIMTWQLCVGNPNGAQLPLAIVTLFLQFFISIYNFLIAVGSKGQKPFVDKRQAILHSYILFPVLLLSIFVTAISDAPHIVFYILSPVVIIMSWVFVGIHNQFAKAEKAKVIKY